ncbi:MAG: membrane protein insertase YidC [bacterium]|jgi:YidC/Oxa1 family membrane protein insertase|nr:membrane protein insertase YidC [Gemmatimonadota bacterium]HIL90455.1 membrane protein insertase YidC [Gemmatimonadota bacterium]
MNLQARFVLTLSLMFLVMMATNVLFPPAIPEEAISADSATGAEVVTETESSAEVVPTMPEIAPSPSEVPETVEDEALPEERRVVVSSPLYRFEFSNFGARLHVAEMSQFEPLNHDGLLDLIPDGVEGYLGQKLVVGSDTLDLSRVPFTVEPEDGLTLEAGADAQILRFTYQHPTSAFRFETEYEFSPDEYTIRVRGRASGVDRPQLLTDLGDGLAFAEADSAMEAREMGYVYNHVQEGIDETLTSKAERMIVEGPLLWGALRNKFFLLAILAGESNEATTEGGYLGGLLVEESRLPERFQVTAAQVVGAEGDFAYRLFLGPQDFEMLSALGWDMQNVNPYGWSFMQVILKPFVSLITKILIWVHSNLNLGYGWVLILFGVGMRIVLFPLNQKAMKSQLKNMAVQPLMKEIQEKYKDNPEKLAKEMKKLYTEHGFNPLGGCLPMLLPWPMLIAFFFVFQSTIELRGVPFLWLPDLSTKDPTYVLPFFLGASMFLMQYVSYKSMDTPNPQMKMMMYMMPPFMIFIFMNLASGLNLYYATANIATIPQQMYIARERKKMQGMKPLGRSPPSPSG